MSLTALLSQHKWTTALIVDDAYDAVPLAEDLQADDEAWTIFIADLGDDRAILAEAFPAFEKLDTSLLRRSNEFVAAVWNLRSKLRPALWDTLFQNYQQTSESDRTYLRNLETALQTMEIEPIRAGRTIPEVGRQAPLIFIDLFLGSGQTNADMEQSIIRLRDLLSNREGDPPVVILMSRSHRLSDKKAHFRDNVPLLGALFRVHSKSDLLITLAQTIERLARHYADALRLSNFLRSWDIGLESAKKRFLTTIRRLDLADYGQIRQLLLDFEGQKLGSYLLDVFDLVLHHEIEANPATIAAAEALSEIDTSRYPPPYIAGSPDLQELVYRSTYQHHERLNVNTTDCGAPVSFGDILLKRPLGLHLHTASAKQDETADVLVVMTAACDLARGGAKRIMLMAGTLEELTSKNWTYKALVKTPIIILPDGRRMWIQWHLKDLQSVQPADLAAKLGTNGTYQRIVRLRESHALELQQRLLADLGRVGVVAQLPATFPVSVEIFSIGVDGILKRWPSLPTLEKEGGVFFTGRNREADSLARLILSEMACDEILAAISKLEADGVHQKSRDSLRRLKASTSFAATLEQGLPVPGVDKKALFTTLRTPSQSADGKASMETVGVIARNPADLNKVTEKDYTTNGAFVLIWKDIEPDTKPNGGETEAAGNPVISAVAATTASLSPCLVSARAATCSDDLAIKSHSLWHFIKRIFVSTRMFRWLSMTCRAADRKYAA